MIFRILQYQLYAHDLLYKFKLYTEYCKQKKGRSLNDRPLLVLRAFSTENYFTSSKVTAT